MDDLHISVQDALSQARIGEDVDLADLFYEEEYIEAKDIEYLGDPTWYTQVVLSDPPSDAQSLEVYKEHFNVDTTDLASLLAFWQSDEFLDWYCSIDPLLFFERYLGHIVKPFHVEWVQMARMRKDVIILAPRDHGKSQTISRDYALWGAFYGYFAETLIISETGPQSVRIIDGKDSIKEQVENNPKLHWMMPERGSKLSGNWAKQSVQFSNGCRIKGIGFGTRSRGEHPDLIILDDVLSDQNCMTPDLRQAQIDYYSQTIVPMKKKNTKVIMVGTAQHQDDMLHHFAKTKAYFVKKYQGLDELTGTTLWEERHDKTYYVEYRETYGELSFQKEYQNNPIDDTLSLFPEELLISCLDRNLSYVEEYKGDDATGIGCDFSPPGGSKTGRGDYTVYMNGAIDSFGTIRLLYFERFRDKPGSKDPFLAKQLQYLENCCTNYQIASGFAESVGFQSIYTKDYAQRTMNLPIEEIHTSRSQKADLKSGIPYIRTLMEQGKMKFPYKTKQDQQFTHKVMAELKGARKDDDGRIINMARHDDIMIALWLMVKAVLKGGKGQMRIIPKADLGLRGRRSSSILGRRRKRH